MTHQQDTLQESIIALQTDLDVHHVMDIAEALKNRMAPSERPLPTPMQVAKALMSTMRTSTGTPVQWPISKSGQECAPMFRATRMILEYILQNS